MDTTLDPRSPASAQKGVTTPLVSVIVPTHRRPELLRRALQSVLAQTYPAIEIHVVENGARAGAEQVVNELGGSPRGLFYQYVPDANVCVARNDGIRLARGAYCAFLDDDDEWVPEKLARQIERLENDPTLGWITCLVWRMESSTVLEEQPSYQGSLTLAALVTAGCFIWTPSCVVVRRECFSTIEMFNPTYRHAADYDLYLRLARQFAFAVVNEPMVRYHQHAGNMSRSRAGLWRHLLKITASVKPSADQGLTASEIRDVVNRYCRSVYGFASEALARGDYAQAGQHFRTAVRYDPAVGLKIPWGRIKHPAYRLVRPYVGLLFCRLKTLGRRRTARRQ